MVRIVSIGAGFLALLASAEACQGWYQCKQANGDHCCVIDSNKGPGGCPGHCTGGTAWPAECIAQVTGNSRHAC
ncbi:hypothetical protein PTMSG1_06851 [Pyrenophora teres f. maculata]|nr:hypothetical protein PTMSG1_06851 [Pyrenophora teres f. maculata]